VARRLPRRLGHSSPRLGRWHRQLPDRHAPADHPFREVHSRNSPQPRLRTPGSWVQARRHRRCGKASTSPLGRNQPESDHRRPPLRRSAARPARGHHLPLPRLLQSVVERHENTGDRGDFDPDGRRAGCAAWYPRLSGAATEYLDHRAAARLGTGDTDLRLSRPAADVLRQQSRRGHDGDVDLRDAPDGAQYDLGSAAGIAGAAGVRQDGGLHAAAATPR